jgi:hypothetical protein
MDCVVLCVGQATPRLDDTAQLRRASFSDDDEAASPLSPPPPRQRPVTTSEKVHTSIAELMYPWGLMLNFSMNQSGVEFKCPYSNRPLKPLTPSIGLTQSLFSGT